MDKQLLEQDEKFIMWDAINGDFYEHESLDDVLKDLKENYCDPEEGIHPDIETIQIFKEVADVVLEEASKNTYRVKVVPRAAYIAGATKYQKELEAARKEIDRLKELNNELWKSFGEFCELINEKRNG